MFLVIEQATPRLTDTNPSRRGNTNLGRASSGMQELGGGGGGNPVRGKGCFVRIMVVVKWERWDSSLVETMGESSNRSKLIKSWSSNPRFPQERSPV